MKTKETATRTVPDVDVAAAEEAAFRTHKVLMPLTAHGRDLQRGDLVDASDWESLELLEREGYVVPIAHDPALAARIALVRADRKVAALEQECKDARAAIERSRQRIPTLQARVDELDRLLAERAHLLDEIKEAQQTIQSGECLIEDLAPRRQAAIAKQRGDAERTLTHTREMAALLAGPSAA